MGSGASSSGKVPDEETAEPTLYMWPGSAPCRAVLMAARAANVYIETNIVDIFKKESKEAVDMEKLNPEKTLPYLIDKKKKIHDSHEIMCYLMKKHAKKQKIYPQDDKKALVDKFLTYNKKVAFPAITGWLYPQIFQRKEPNPEKEKAIHSCLDHLDIVLKDQPFTAISHVTIADFSLVTSVTLLELKDYDFTRWTRVQEWIHQMKDLPFYASCNHGIEEWKFALHMQSENS